MKLAFAAALTLSATSLLFAQDAVKIIATYSVAIRTPSGEAKLPLDISLDWSKPQPQVTRAVILLHGKGRDVDGYYKGLERSAQEAGAAAAGSILIAPQFLNEHDIEAHGLPHEIVRWRTGAWEAGGPAIGPAPISAYEALDALFDRLADKTLFPNMKDIVLAGHSGGGQAVQRYAVVGRAPGTMSGRGIHVRFVIANPSSYLYFSDDRPGPHGFGCSDWNRWKSGPSQGRVPSLLEPSAVGVSGSPAEIGVTTGAEAPIISIRDVPDVSQTLPEPSGAI